MSAATPTPEDSNLLTRLSPARLRRIAMSYAAVIALIILVIAVSSQSSAFLTSENLLNLTSQWAPAGIMAVGMTFVIITGGFDLSIASGYSLCAVIAAGLGRNHPPVVAFAAAIGAGLGMGMLNAVLVAFMNINPFIATVGTGSIFNGIALVLTGNNTYIVENPAFGTLGSNGIGGVPFSGMILFAALVIGGVVLAKTVYGQQIYATGGSREASRLSGVLVRSVTGSAYVMSGFCVAIAGIITASQLGSAQSNLDVNIVFDVITIVVVGGTSLAGGIGAMWRTAVGIALLATISNGFVVLQIDPNYQDIIKGVIIIIALGVDVWSRHMSSFRPRFALAGMRAPRRRTE